MNVVRYSWYCVVNMVSVELVGQESMIHHLLMAAAAVHNKLPLDSFQEVT